MEREISKKEFRALYIKYGQSQKDSGWTQDYWNEFYAHETGKRYFFTEPASPKENRLFIVDNGTLRRMFLMTEEADEAFFWHPDW
jgi:hypothetical protein